MPSPGAAAAAVRPRARAWLNDPVDPGWRRPRPDRHRLRNDALGAAVVAGAAVVTGAALACAAATAAAFDGLAADASLRVGLLCLSAIYLPLMEA